MHQIQTLSLTARLLRAAVLVLACLSAAALRAAAPASDLLKLVHEDVGLCVQLNDLGTNVPQLLESQAAQRLVRSKLYQSWLECDEYRKLDQSRKAIERLSNRPFGQFATELFGKSVVLALYPSEHGKVEGAVLTETADADVVDQILAAWNEKKNVAAATLAHRGVAYHRRTKTWKKSGRTETLYYLKLDKVFVLSDHESMIRRVIELHPAGQDRPADGAQTAAARSLYESGLYHKATADLSADALAVVYFNPRVAERALGPLPAGADPGEKLLRDAWQQMESVAAAVRFDEGLVVEAVIHSQRVATAEGGGGAAGDGASGRLAFLAKVPRVAVAVAAGRIDAAAVAAALGKLVSAGDREKLENVRRVGAGLLLGMDLFDDVLPKLGPNWTAYVVPRTNASSASDCPIDVVIAVQLPAESQSDPAADPGAKPDQSAPRAPSLHAALQNALVTGLNLLAARHNSESKTTTAVVRSKETPQGQTYWIENLEKFTVACALTKGELVLASAPEAVDEFLATAAAGDVNAGFNGSPVRHAAARHHRHADQALLVDVGVLRRLIAENRGFFTGHAEGKKSAAAGTAAAAADAAASEGADAKTPAATGSDPDLARVEDILQLFDTAFLTIDARGDRLRIVAGAVIAPESIAAPANSP